MVGGNDGRGKVETEDHHYEGMISAEQGTVISRLLCPVGRGGGVDPPIIPGFSNSSMFISRIPLQVLR